MSTISITHINGPTALIEVEGLRLLTDPTFDLAGGHYRFGWGTSSDKTTSPAVGPEQLGHIDAILLSHDQHGDNLDEAGRAMLPTAERVVTTGPGAKRLGGNALGLAPWESTTIATPAGGQLKITATPCRHGPPLSRPIVGAVIGFMLEWDGQQNGAFWISGDTVYFSGVAEVAKRFDVGTGLLHLGGVRFPISGPARYTMNAKEAVRVGRDFGLATLIPIHFDGWKHFREGRSAVEQEFAGTEIEERVHWLTPGHAETIEV